MNPLQTLTSPDVQVETRGEVSAAAPGYARAKLAAVVERIHEPVLAVRVKLVQSANHAVVRPSLAQAVVDVDGRPVRAHVAAATMAEAIDLLKDRLTDRLERVRQHRAGHRHLATPPHRAAAERAHRPHRADRRPQERRIVRHKSYSLPSQDVWAAVFELEAMDYDFHLFTDADTGRECVVERDATDGGHRLTSTAANARAMAGLTVSAAEVPVLAVAEAVERLELGGWAHVFFVDAQSGRGNVLYHRYDGHYGLITPAQ